MDVLVSGLRNCGFVCLNNDYSNPIVVNCVPGSGKSTLIRGILEKDSRFEAITFGIPDPPNLSGRFIKGHEKGFSEAQSLRIVDEYTEGNWRAYQPRVIFGDPIQSLSTEGLKADFICTKTRRFGRNTCNLLNRLGFEISSDLEDQVVIKGLYEAEPSDIIIAADQETYKLAREHNLEVLCVQQVRGETFERTTVLVSEEEIPKDRRAEYFVALTRHRKKLTVLSPDASFGST